MEANLVILLIGLGSGAALGGAVAYYLNQWVQTEEVRLYRGLSSAAIKIAHLQIDKRAADNAAANLAATDAAKAKAKADVAAI